MAGKSWWQDFEAADPIASALRKEIDECWC